MQVRCNCSTAQHPTHFRHDLVVDLANLDCTRRLRRYKIQQDKHVTLDEYKRAALVTLRNQVLINLPVSFAFYRLLHRRGWTLRADLPGLREVLTHFLVFYIIEDICFYYFHRLLHHRSLYKHIHKVCGWLTTVVHHTCIKHYAGAPRIHRALWASGCVRTPSRAPAVQPGAAAAWPAAASQPPADHLALARTGTQQPSNAACVSTDHRHLRQLSTPSTATAGTTYHISQQHRGMTTITSTLLSITAFPAFSIGSMTRRTSHPRPAKAMYFLRYQKRSHNLLVT